MFSFDKMTKKFALGEIYSHKMLIIGRNCNKSWATKEETLLGCCVMYIDF